MTNDYEGGYGTVNEEQLTPAPVLPSLWLPWAKEIAHDRKNAEMAARLRHEIARTRADPLRALAEEVDPEELPHTGGASRNGA
jgi:hypothetical protein